MKLFSVVLAVLIVIYSSFSSASQKFQSVESDRESKELAVSESRPIEKISVSANRNYLNQKTLMALPADTLLVNEQLSPNRSITDWLVQLPGLSLNGQGGLMQSYSLRGFSRARIRTEVDGIPLITDRRAGNSASFISPDFISSLAVQKGASSTIYGSGAIGGVVNLYTIADNSQKFSASHRSNTKQQSLSFNYGVDQYQGGISYRKSGNSLDANGQTLNDGFSQTSALFKMQTQVNNLDFLFSWLLSVTKDIGKSSALYPKERITLYPEEIHSLSQFQLRSSQEWLLRLFHHYQNWDSEVERVGKRINLTQYQAHTLGGLYYQKHNLFFGEGRIGLDWLARQGVKIDETELSLDRNINFQQNLINGQQNNYAIFADEHWQFESVKLMAGLRADFINQKNLIVEQKSARSKHKLNGTLALTWQASTQWSFRTEYGTSFRFPSLTELYFNGDTPRGLTVGNSSLLPETSKGFAFDIQYQNDIAEITLNSYQQHIDNYIERFRVDPNTRSYRNLSAGKILGLELSIDWQFVDEISHKLSYQWQQGEDDKGETLADLNSPQWQLNTTWQLTQSTLQSNLRYRVADDNYADGEQRLQSAFILDFKWQWQLFEQFSIELSGNNLFNKLYYGSSDEDAAFQPGRTIGLSFTWQP